jgi:hypothetical protein
MIGFATIRTVSNHPSTLAQFNTIQAAVNASVSGDTLMVHGTPVAYAGFTITNKRLVVIGPGFSPDVQAPMKATISTNVVITGAASKKTEIQGFHFLNATLDINSTLDSLYFYRNNFNHISFVQGGGTISGFVFNGNYIRGQISTHPVSVFHNMLFENNVFRSNNCIINLTAPGSTNILFNHNLFYAPDVATGNIFSGVSLAMFTNNIFVDRNFNSTVTLCTFIDNLTFACSPNNPWSANGNVDGGGNIENMDPQMADQAAVNDGTATEISNYTIASGPANNSGSDGKDMGLLYDPTGGINWIQGRNSRLPSVVLMNITNPVLGAGGMLNVTVEARKNE